MFQIKKQKIWVGDFHGQWREPWENLPLLLSAYSVCGFDFSMFNSGDTSPGGPFNTLVRKLDFPFLIPPYCHELMYDWGHLMVCGMDNDYEPPKIDRNDYREVLRELKPHCRLISLAHPYGAFIPETGELLDEHLLDCVAFNDPAMDDWYQSRLKAGKRTPIVTELDFHMTAGKRKSLISYGSETEANLDLAPVSERCTLVFCDELTEDSIYDAVKAGRTCVDLNGKLFGPPDLVHSLEDGGYFGQKEEARRKRENLKLTLPAGLVPQEGEVFSLIAEENGSKSVIDIPALDNVSGRPSFFYPVRIGGQCRTVQVMTSQQAWILPGFKENAPIVTLRISNNSLTAPAAGRFKLLLDGKTILAEQEYEGIGCCFSRDFVIPLPNGTLNAEIPHKIMLDLKPENLSARQIERDLLCIRIPYSAELSAADFVAATPIRLNRKEQLDPLWLSNWNGPEDSSAEIRMVWDKSALHIRAEITDTILAPSAKPQFLFMGDSLQFGFIPLERSDVDSFSFYHFISTRGGQPDGREFCELDNVPGGTILGHRPLPCRIPRECYRLRLVSDTHSVLELDLPWNLMPLMRPKEGFRFLSHFILWDNDGNGLKASLSWPGPGMWYKPDDPLWACMELF